MADGARWPGGTQRVGDHLLIGGDCLDVMSRHIEKQTVDVVVTSPPYNLNLRYNVYDDSKAEADYLEWLTDVAAAVRQVMRPDGSFFLNISGSNSAPWLPFELVVRLRKAGFFLQNHITWIKSVTIHAASSGHFKPVPGNRFLHHNHEHIFHLTLNNDVVLDRLAIGSPFQDKSNIARRGHSRDLRCRGNTWFIPYSTVKTKAQKFWHPGTFPIELPLWCIYLHGRPGAVVLDPFMGTGSTLVAAHFARTKGIGIDIDPSYLETARQRLSETVEDTRLVTLSRDEIAALYRQDDARRGDGGWQARLVAFQQRVNRTTGVLALTHEEIAWLKRHGKQQHLWREWIGATFGRHVGLGGDV